MVDRREAARRMRQDSYSDTLYVFYLIRLAPLDTFLGDWIVRRDDQGRETWERETGSGQ